MNAVKTLCPASLCIALAIGGLSGCRHEQAAATSVANTGGADALVRVTPVQPTREALVRFTEQPGQIAALESTPIYAKLSGFVRRVHVDIGDQVTGPVYEDGVLVKAGQTLAEIDMPELTKELAQKKALVQQAKAEVKQAEAAVRVAKASHASAAADVKEAGAMVDRVAADRDRWESELARITDLAARQAVTNKLVDETQSKFRAAAASGQEISAKIESAEARLNEAQAQIEKAEADVDAAAAKRDVAVADEERIAALLNYTSVYAPFDGVVAARHVDAGHLVSMAGAAREPLFVVVSTDTMRIFVDVPEVDAVLLQPGAEAHLRVASLGNVEFQGVVTRTTWVLDQATRTLRTEIDVANPEKRLRPGMYVYARLKVAESKDALVIPKTALMSSAGQSFCWIVQADGALVKQPIQTGIEVAGKVEVLAGLSEQQRIIGVNPAAFREGQRVEIATPSSPK